MNTDIQLLDPDKKQVDMFFDARPVVTDWEDVRRLVTLGLITSKEALADVKAFEPLREADPREHQHWVAQQCLRLALLREAGKPLETDLICEDCGKNKMDSLYADRGYSNVCLACAERNRQLPNMGSRGSCEFLRPHYNHRSRSWGLLYYWSHGGKDETLIFWLADFFKSYDDALNSLRPMYHYYKWLGIKYDDLIQSWLSFRRLLPLDEIMKLSLPLTPDQFRAHLRSIIEADMSQEHQLMTYYVDEAMRDHERKERDE